MFRAQQSTHLCWFFVFAVLVLQGKFWASVETRLLQQLKFMDELKPLIQLTALIWPLKSQNKGCATTLKLLYTLQLQRASEHWKYGNFISYSKHYIQDTTDWFWNSCSRKDALQALPTGECSLFSRRHTRLRFMYLQSGNCNLHQVDAIHMKRSLSRYYLQLLATYKNYSPSFTVRWTIWAI